MKTIRIFTMFAAVALSVTAAFAQTSIKVETHHVVSCDEQFNVTFIIEGENNPTDFAWECGDGFSLIWGPQQGRSTSISIINGKRTKSVQTTYTYVLKPTGEGNFTIPSAKAKIKGNEIQSSPVSVEVIGSQSSSSGAPSASSQGSRQPEASERISGDDLLLDVSLSRSSVVVGEPVIATIKLYQRANIAGFENASFPTFDGFWSQELEAPTNIEFTRETFGGQIYNAALLRKYIIIPQREGTLQIDPAELVCLVNVRVSSSSGNSIFDSFFDDGFRTVRRKVVSKPLRVKVLPLPAGAPASFAGGVGSFKVSAKVSRDTLKTHEAASLLVTVTGTGNISLLDAPKVKFPPDMEVYDTKISEKIDKGGRSGSKYYEFPFIPRSHGDFVIPPVEYSYYDTASGKYVTLSTQPVPVHVEKGAETDGGGRIVAPGISRNDVKTLGSDIRYINTKTQTFSEKGKFFVGSGLFWTVSVLLFALSLLCWAIFRKLASRRADVVGNRNRKATQMALKRLRLAETFLKQNLYTAFYEELHKALQGFISDKLNIPMSELSRENMSGALHEGGVSDGLVEEFIGLLDACEFARYSPDAGHDAMEAHYKKAVEVISSIDSNMKSKKNIKSSGAAMLVTLLLMLPSVSQAALPQDYADSLWNSANNAYSQGQWDEALADYQLIESAGLESAALYCNIGDAFFKASETARAILYYERALKIDPSYSDARYNLTLARESVQDRIEPVPEFILKTWTRNLGMILNSDSWAICFLAFFALTLALVLLFILAPTVALRRTGFFSAIVTLLLACGCLGFSFWQKSDYMSADEAIVMLPVTSVKSSPSESASKDLFILHEGTKVRILDQVGTWRNIQLADGRQGWLQSDELGVI